MRDLYNGVLDCIVQVPWCITLDNSKGISRLRFWAKKEGSMESMTYLYLCTKAVFWRYWLLQIPGWVVLAGLDRRAHDRGR